eukprot:687010-Karenia_brevis.AAC.1
MPGVNCQGGCGHTMEPPPGLSEVKGGEKEMCGVEERGGQNKRLTSKFQVAEVKKPLIAVKKIVEKGNW